jgi:hypothetical protein
MLVEHETGHVGYGRRRAKGEGVMAEIESILGELHHRIMAQFENEPPRPDTGGRPLETGAVVALRRLSHPERDGGIVPEDAAATEAVSEARFLTENTPTTVLLPQVLGAIAGARSPGIARSRKAQRRSGQDLRGASPELVAATKASQAPRLGLSLRKRASRLAELHRRLSSAVCSDVRCGECCEGGLDDPTPSASPKAPPVGARGEKPRTGQVIIPASLHQQASALLRSARASSAWQQFPDLSPLSRRPAPPPS